MDRPPPATRSELFTPFQPSIDFPGILKSQTSVFTGNRPSREPGYSSHHIASAPPPTPWRVRVEDSGRNMRLWWSHGPGARKQEKGARGHCVGCQGSGVAVLKGFGTWAQSRVLPRCPPPPGNFPPTETRRSEHTCRRSSPVAQRRDHTAVAQHGSSVLGAWGPGEGTAGEQGVSGTASGHVFQQHRIVFPTLDAPRNAHTGQQLLCWGADPSGGSGAAPWRTLRGRTLSAGTRPLLLLLLLMKTLSRVSAPIPAQPRRFPPSVPWSFRSFRFFELPT